MESAQLSNVPSSIQEIPAGDSLPIIKQLDSSALGGWERFVQCESKATFFHLLGWRNALENTFGYEACYFYVERKGKITGILPLFRINNWLMGTCLISIPFAVYGGICATDELSAKVLYEHAIRLAQKERVQFLELRQRRGGILPGFYPNPRYATFTTQLSPDDQVNLKRLPRDTRYIIRKGDKQGLTSRRGLEYLEEFYRLFVKSMKRHGTPAFPLLWFQNLIGEFQDKIDLLMVYARERAVSGVLFFRFKDTVLPYYAGADHDANGIAASSFMYWELMKLAAREGILFFDFGRSKKGTGSFSFKRQWNMSVEPLDYQVYLVRRKDVPNFSPLNRKLQVMTRLWRHIPLPVGQWLGPNVIRWFP